MAWSNKNYFIRQVPLVVEDQKAPTKPPKPAKPAKVTGES